MSNHGSCLISLVIIELFVIIMLITSIPWYRVTSITNIGPVNFDQQKLIANSAALVKQDESESLIDLDEDTENSETLIELDEDPYLNKKTTFYMYSADDSKQLKSYQQCIKNMPTEFREFSQTKHGSEIWFLRQLENSTWRVFEKDAAALVVVPIHPGFISRYRKCLGPAIAFWRSLKGGRDERHVFLSTDHQGQFLMNQMCKNCVNLKTCYDTPRPLPSTACQVISPMNSQLTNEKENRTFLGTNPYSWESRNYAYYFGAQGDGRASYATRRRGWRSLERISNIANGKVGLWNKTLHLNASDPLYLEHMMDTKLGLHLPGDNPSSSRIYEMIQIDIPLVIISDLFYEKCAPGLDIPWKQFSLQFPEDLTDSELDSTLVQLSNMPSEKGNQMVSQMKKYKERLVWQDPNSKVAETLLLDVVNKCEEHLKPTKDK